MTTKPAAADRIRLVVLDWAGTAVDCGCFAPVVPFVEALGAVGVRISADEARGPMGLAKRDHLGALFATPDIAKRWREAHGHDATEAEIDSVYEKEFMPRQSACVRDCSGLVPGLLAAVDDLRRRGIKIATSTGYFAEAAQIAYDSAAAQGYRPDFNSSAGDVAAGRPAPWMIYRAMQALDIYPPAAVLKVGDTVPDVGEGRNAGVWTACVTSTSSGVGLSEAELAALVPDERRRRCEVVERELLAAGAHVCIDSVADLPGLVEQFEARLRRGERP